MSGGTMSGRVESSWPNLTNVGPSSSSISRMRRPRLRPAPVQLLGRPVVAPERVAESMARGDLGDLPEPRKVLTPFPAGHRANVAAAADAAAATLTPDVERR